MDPRHLRIEGYFASAPEHSLESLRRTFAQAGLDGAWLRIAPVRAASNGGAALGCVLAEVSAFGSDQLLASQEALRSLSAGGRTAFVLVYAGDEDRVLYEAYRDGARIGGWEGIRREYPTTVEPDSGRGDAHEQRERETQRAFNAVFRGHTGMDFEALLGSDAAWPILDHNSRPGTEAFFLGRRLRVPVGTPKLLDLFRFRDRSGSEPGDRMAFLALDVPAAGRLLRTAPAATVAQLLARLDETAAVRLGPFMHAVSGAAAEVGAMPPEAPVAAGQPSLDLVELVHIAHTGGGTSGDTVEYFDQVFFPLLNLYDSGALPPLETDDVAGVANVGALRAMADLLPYNSPEGQLLESFAQGEIRPLAPAHASGGEYDGSLFLVDRARVRGLLAGFEGARLMELVESFLSAWCRTLDPETTDAGYAAWRRGRDHLDREDALRFATTLAELRAVVGLCDENGLELGLVFYEA